MSAATKPVEICGMSCFNCDEESPRAPTREAMEEAAYHAGWMLGLQDDGNAHYACADCASLLYCETPAWPINWTAAQCSAADRAATLARAQGGAP